ncbi:MAG: putative Ig domain-containing protein, partial [Candidatus Korobacteraceae bacterium]
MKWKALPLLGLGLILCVMCTGCGSSSNSASGPLTITAATLPTGTVGTAYSYSLPATGGIPPYVWSINSGTLPAGLKLSTKGTISGTPVAAGTVSFTVAIIDSEAVPASTTASFSISIQSELAVTSISPPAGTVGVNYSTTLAATGGVTPYTWSLASGSLPAGLSLSASGVISGKPTASGASTFTVQVADSGGTSQQTAIAQLTIAINVVTITTMSLPNAAVNVLYSAPLAAIGGVTPYSWTMSGTLPSGLSLNSAGVISGTPISTGSATFTVHV